MYMVLVMTLPVLAQSRLTPGALLMNYGTGIYDFEETDFEMAEFGEFDSFMGFRHVHYDAYVPTSYVKTYLKHENRRKRIIASILDSLGMIDANEDTVVIAVIHNYYDLSQTKTIVISRRDSIFVDFEGLEPRCHSLNYYLANDFWFNEDHKQNPSKVLVDVVSRFNEKDFNRLMACSLDMSYHRIVSVSQAIIHDGALVSREIFVFPYFELWCMYDRYDPNNPYRWDIENDDILNEYNRKVREGAPQEELDIYYKKLMGE